MLDAPRSGLLTNLWCDRQSSAETVHRFVILPTQVEQNSESTLKLWVHLGGVRISGLEEQILDISKQRSGEEKQKENRGRKKQKEVSLKKWLDAGSVANVSTGLTLAAVTQAFPSRCPFLWHRPFGARARVAPTQNGTSDCASASREESRTPACAAIRS